MEYAAFLRGVNVGGKNRVRMETLRQICAALGFADVRTYINSGNLVFSTIQTDEKTIVEKIETAIEKEFGLEIKVVVRTRAELVKVISNNPFAGQFENDTYLHVFFLGEELPPDKCEQLVSKNNADETYAACRREIYCLLRVGVRDSLMGKDFIGKKLKVSATARNWRTVNRILEL